MRVYGLKTEKPYNLLDLTYIFLHFTTVSVIGQRFLTPKHLIIMNYIVLLLYRKLYGGRKRNKCNGKKILLLQMLAAGLDESQGFLFYEKKIQL